MRKILHEFLKMWQMNKAIAIVMLLYMPIIIITTFIFIISEIINDVCEEIIEFISSKNKGTSINGD